MKRFFLFWPVPALLAWAAAWALFAGAWRIGLPALAALAAGTLAGVACSLLAHNWWRRAIVSAGFPLSLAASGVLVLPGWAWLLPLGLLLLVYPLNAWRDAPMFPTPPDALEGLQALAPLPAGAWVLDAGCGLGHGLRALRAAYPAARLHGTEWSWPLRGACGLRCPWARVRRGDIWREDWSAFALVYLFQRPESMPRAAAKAVAELPVGAWLVSLEFAAPATEGLVRQARLPGGGRSLWVYRRV
ncbi:MAG: class I SAM-dependent methyltransferase [Pseudomonadota bacterium]